MIVDDTHKAENVERRDILFLSFIFFAKELPFQGGTMCSMRVFNSRSCAGDGGTHRREESRRKIVGKRRIEKEEKREYLPFQKALEPPFRHAAR